MAHNINRTAGKYSIVWTGQTPWHRLGTALPEAFTAAEALQHGGLDYTVEKVPLQTMDGEAIRDRFGLRRTDTRAVLGICAGMYRPLQNREAFSFFDGVFGKDKARYEVAGALGDGERVWMLAKLPGEFEALKGDSVNQYLLLTNGFDTNEPVRARFTPVRVVCQNTLSLAMAGTQSEVRVQHIGNVHGKLEIAGKLLKAAGVYFDEAAANFRAFAVTKLKAASLRSYVLNVVAPEREAGAKLEDLHPVTRNRVAEVEKMNETGVGHDIKGVRGTLWGAYNAVTEYVDHNRTREDLGYIVDGGGARLKQRAFEVALDIAKSAN
jgi:phage/plasmid-like protein (TIGR03299 family)